MFYNEYSKEKLQEELEGVIKAEGSLQGDMCKKY